jgi:glycosyltransferase involved in cell wall biosynthesis
MRICLVYDCLYPHTVGGAERRYRSLAILLAQEGHEVTYLTLTQWPPEEVPEVPGVAVVAVGPRMPLYGKRGTRRVLPPLVFGVGVLVHLLLRGRRYDAVHSGSFPYFSLLAAAAMRTLWRFRLVVDWYEVWTLRYWRDYLGPIGGSIGWAVQRLCARVRHRAFCFSRLHAERLRAEGFRGDLQIIAGGHEGSRGPREVVEPEPVVLFAGRHIPEKRAPAVVSALALARKAAPELRGVILGDGPERPEVLAEIERHGLDGAVSAPGFVDAGEVERRLRSALCLVLPSRREGYGLVVVEAAACGTPTIVVRDPDSAATELIEEGQNGFVAESADAEALTAAILRVREEGFDLRRRTAEWFRRHAGELSLERSLAAVAASYGEDAQRSTTSR